MPRPKPSANKGDPEGRKTIQIAIRIDTGLVKRGDVLIDHVADLFGIAATRTDVLREAMSRGIRSLEKEAVKK